MRASVRERIDAAGQGAIVRPPSQAAGRWHGVADGTRGVRSRLWRTYCDRLNAELVTAWLEPGRAGLKTDLFDEAVGDGLIGVLAREWEAVYGIDVVDAVVRSASRRNPGLRGVVADVRSLPYPSESLDAVLSNSTLDHFDDPEDIDVALAEIARVLVPGGRALVTLDNLANPVVWLRSILSPRLLHRLGLVPFHVGRTLTRRGLAAAVERAGLVVEGSDVVMHVPRVPAVWACDLAGRTGRSGSRLLSILLSAERLGRLRTRDRTAYYVVVYASRPGG
jgi:SAM-dependent methyltransferase